MALYGVALASAQGPENVLVVVNKQSALSRRVGDYYVHKRGIPVANVCVIDTEVREEITRATYTGGIESPIGRCLKRGDLQEKILFLVTTIGVPLKVEGPGAEMKTEAASVDSELSELYAKLHGAQIPLAGPARNPFYGQRDAPFRHPNFPIYLVTRLAGYDFRDVNALIDRGLAAKNTGKFVIDLRADNNTEGNQWLRDSATLLPRDRVVLEETGKVVYDQKQVIGYASWGSNDPDRKRRMLGFEWLPGAIATEFVSTNGRTFERPPASWNIGSWKDKGAYFAGSPQTMTADFIHEGASGASGHVYEPFLHLCPRPDYILPAYASGRTLAESYYMGLPGLSWQNVVIGDPLCRLK